MMNEFSTCFVKKNEKIIFRAAHWKIVMTERAEHEGNKLWIVCDSTPIGSICNEWPPVFKRKSSAYSKEKIPTEIKKRFAEEYAKNLHEPITMGKEELCEQIFANEG